MLSELFIRDFAIIDELRLQLAAGFNVLTGETGAGKSIILDAVALVLGDRADSTVVRAGSQEAYVEAVFEIDDTTRRAVAPILETEGLEDDSAGFVTLAREVRSNGRSICRVNGRTVNLALLRQIAEPLIDIHGQGEHLSLLKPRSHLPLLDAFAGLLAEQRELSAQVGQLRTIQHDLASLRQNQRLHTQRIDMLSYQIKEIDAANLKVGEEEDLREERVRLANVEHLMKHAGEALALMNGMEDDEAVSISDMLGQAERALSQLTRFDASQATSLETLQGLAFQFGEVAANLQDYLEELEFNPDRLNFVEERLEMINTLKRKYGDDIGAILSWRAAAQDELEQIGSSEERAMALANEEDRRLRRIGVMAADLSHKRKTAAERLAQAVERELTDLQMDGTRFSVAFDTLPDEDGIYVAVEGKEQRLAFDKSGADRVEFLISTNPGEPLKPMAKVASGGETSRLMLALKTALTAVDGTTTLIFDEIDQGIGGRVGDVAGRKLWQLTSGNQHQVIVVTHLPQLAGYGDTHFHVSKLVKEGRTTTAVVNLDQRGRVGELAAMLGTHGEHAIGGAESILRQAAVVKSQMTRQS